MEEIKINIIGNVKVKKGQFCLSIREPYREALIELETFSHINIIWWGDRSDTKENREITTADKPYRNGPSKIGIFATRSQIRPNPILITTSSIISVDMERGIIELPWIDAEDGTPVLDIKPYHPCSDRVRNTRQPDWCSNWPDCYEESGSFDWSSVFNF
jgi:tRNA-Thr(GGU) m(6)t(6)A37 methyltransferase TsaA